MPNIIEIIIQGTGNFQGTFTQAEEAMSGMGAAANRLVGLLGGPVGVGIAAVGAGAAVVELGNKLSDSIEQFENMSRKTGASVNDLRALGRVMYESGLSSESLSGALTLANRNLATQADELAKLGITAKTPMEALLQLSDQVTKFGVTSQTAHAASVLLGRGFGEMLPILSNLRPALKDMHERLGDLDQSTIEAAGAWDKLMDRMGTATKRFLDGVGAAFLKFVDQPRQSAIAALRQFNVVPTQEQAKLLGYFDATPPSGAAAPGEQHGADEVFVPGIGWMKVSKVEEMGKALEKVRDSIGSAQTIEQFAKGMNEADWSRLSAQFGLAGAGVEGTRIPVSPEDLKKSNQAMDDLLKKLALASGSTQKAVIESHLWAEALKAVSEEAASAIASDFDAMFNAVLIQGQSFAKAMGDLLKNIAADLLKIGLEIGLGTLLNATGVGFLGQIGHALGASQTAVPRGGSSQTVIIQALDTRDLRMQMLPGGSLYRANQQLRLGAAY